MRVIDLKVSIDVDEMSSPGELCTGENRSRFNVVMVMAIIMGFVMGQMVGVEMVIIGRWVFVNVIMVGSGGGWL